MSDETSRDRPAPRVSSDSHALVLEHGTDLKLSSRKCYLRDWKPWERCCETLGLSPLAAGETALLHFIATEVGKGRNARSVVRNLFGIAKLREEWSCPIDLGTLAIRNLTGRVLASAPPPTRKKAFTPEILARIDRQAPESPEWIQARGILLFGFASELPCGEISRLDVANLSTVFQFLPKTGARSLSPEGAILRHIETNGIVDGAVFRGVTSRTRRLTDKRIGHWTIATIVKRAAEMIGLEPDGYSSHSLTKGFDEARASADVLRWAEKDLEETDAAP